MNRTRQSAPTHRAATLNGCHGFGYAEVDWTTDGPPTLHGSIAFERANSLFLLQALRQRTHVTYSGVVYEGGQERFVTCGVAVERVRDADGGYVVEFTGPRS